MIKHKNSIVKHKELYPWDLHPPGSASANKLPASFDRREYKSHIDASSFMWMMYWSCKKDHIFDVSHIINYWWNRVYTKDFPEEGGTVEDLSERIYGRLIDRGHDLRRLEPTESEFELPRTLVNSPQWDLAKNQQITKIQIEEDSMAKIMLKKGAGKKSAESKTETPKRRASSGEIPAWITSSKPGTKAHDSKELVCKLLMERKHSDADIVLMVEGELDYKVTEDRVNFYRNTLNKGHFEPLGFEKPEPEVEQITESSGVKPSKKSSAKKAPAKAPAKKETPKKEAPKKAKGKIVLKKKG